MIWIACILLILVACWFVGVGLEKVTYTLSHGTPMLLRTARPVQPEMGQRYPDGSLRPYNPPTGLLPTDLNWYWAHMVLAGVRDGRTGKVVLNDQQIDKLIEDAFPRGNPYDREKSPIQHGRWLAIAIMEQERRRSLGMDVPDEYR